MSCVERMADEAADDAVRLAERQAAADEEVGDVGRRRHLVGGRGGHPLVVEVDPRQHPAERPQAELDRVGGVEERLLVLLQVLAVGERQRRA